MPNPLVPRRVLVELSCGHAVTLDLPPDPRSSRGDPGPGYTLHCYECGHAVQVVSLTPQSDRAADTPILHGRRSSLDGGDTP